jgi:uncharacterized protein YyaL (SSP411 family)
LQRLAQLSGEDRYSKAAERTLRLFQPQFERHPGGFASLLAALEEWLVPPRLVILRGPVGEVAEWRERLGKLPLAGTLTMALPNSLTGLPAVLDKPSGTQVNAWVCSGVTCLAPVARWQDLERILSEPALG